MWPVGARAFLLYYNELCLRVKMYSARQDVQCVCVCDTYADIILLLFAFKSSLRGTYVGCGRLVFLLYFTELCLRVKMFSVYSV